MTRRRLRWVAVQAIVVTALAVVVVLTLLKPESQSPLSAISGGPQIAQGPGSGADGGNGGPGGGANPGGPSGGGDRENGGSNDAADTASPTGTATGSASGSPPVAPAPLPETSPVRPDNGFETPSPTEDQYADTLGALDSAMR